MLRLPANSNEYLLFDHNRLGLVVESGNELFYCLIAYGVYNLSRLNFVLEMSVQFPLEALKGIFYPNPTGSLFFT
jgi:hypothetical protein